MRRVLSLTVFRTVVLLALSASAALLFDYTRPLPAFCQSGGGCETVRRSAFAYVLGVPQPVVGLIALGALFVLSFVPFARRRLWLLPLSIVAGLGGLGFLAIQEFVLHAFCKLCLVVDLSAIVAALCAALHCTGPKQESDGALATPAWAALAGLALVLPYGFGALQPKPPVPAAVAQLWTAGKLNLVELSDFECPFCRLLHPRLTAVLQSYGDKVHLTRVTVPLRSHVHARTASRAYLCANRQGKGELMADALFNAEDMSQDGCLAVAQSLLPQGLDLDQFRGCFTGPGAEAMVEESLARAKQITYRGLPTVWVGTQEVMGAVSEEELREKIDSELKGPATSWAPALPQWALWTGLVGVFALCAAYSVLGTSKPSPDKAKAADQQA